MTADGENFGFNCPTCGMVCRDRSELDAHFEDCENGS